MVLNFVPCQYNIYMSIYMFCNSQFSGKSQKSVKEIMFVLFVSNCISFHNKLVAFTIINFLSPHSSIDSSRKNSSNNVGLIKSKKNKRKKDERKNSTSNWRRRKPSWKWRKRRERKKLWRRSKQKPRLWSSSYYIK